MQKRQGKVFLPRVPLSSSRPGTSTDRFWLEQASSGAIEAFRQLTNARHRHGRKQQPLPGGKLQPLYKNNAAPLHNSREAEAGKYGSRTGIEEREMAASRLGNMNRLVTGDLNNLPPQDPSMVRVYLASDPSDMKVERDELMSKAVPEIQDFCSTFGLTFQLVDLNWNTPPTDYQSAVTSLLIRQEQIAKCQELSVGPNFIALVGDRYGPVDLPPVLQEADLHTLIQTAQDHKLDEDDVLNKVYVKDDHISASDYKLLSSIDRDEEQKVKDVIQKLSALDTTQNFSFLMSDCSLVAALERDITAGILAAKNPRDHCLCYHREWQQLSENISHPTAASYINLTTADDDTVTTDVTKLHRQQTLTQKITNLLGIANKKAYFVPWPSTEEEPSHTKEYAAYLQNLVTNFVADMKHLITQGLERLSKGNSIQQHVYREALFHGLLFSKNIQNFHGQAEILFGVEKFFKDPRQTHMPYIIHGKSGSGLSAITARIAQLVPEWFSSDAVTVLRFLGTTTDCSNIHQLVISLILHISLAYNLQPPDVLKDLDTLFRTLQRFRDILDTVSREYGSTRPLFILLDGIHKLQPVDESLHALWAMKNFPPYVRILITVLTNVGPVNMLQSIVSMLTETSAVAEMKPLEEEAITTIMDDLSTVAKRSLTSEQRELIITTYKDGGESPLHLNLLIQQSLRENLQDEAKLPQSAGACLEEVIESLEQTYGDNVIRYILSQISVAGIGAQERELLDLAVCNSEVNNEIAKQLGTSDLVYYMPQWMWSTIQHELSPYLEDHLCYGKTVIAWKQYEYSLLIAKRYGTVFPGIPNDMISNEATAYTLELHEDIMDRYLQRPLMFDEVTIKPNDKVLCSRQPTSELNLLKLHKLPYHMYVLIPVDGLNDIKQNLYFNFQWLLTKIKATGLPLLYKEMLQTIQLAKSLIEERVLEDETVEDLELLYECLQLSQDCGTLGPNTLAQELLSRLVGLKDKHSSIKKLLDKAEAYVIDNQIKTLLPVHGCLKPPGTALRHRLVGASHVVGVSADTSMAVTFKQSEGLDVWCLLTGKKLHNIPVQAEQNLSGVVLTSATDFIVIGHYSHLNHAMELGVWSTVTGLNLVKSSFPNKFQAFALEPENKFVMIATVMPQNNQEGSSHNSPQNCLIGVESRTREILYTIPVVDVHQDGISQIFFVKGIRGGLQSLVTIGTKLSKDLGYWDLESEQLQYKVDFEHFPDTVLMNTSKKIAVCASIPNGTIYIVNLPTGEIAKTLTQEAWKDIKDLYVSNQGDHLIIVKQNGEVSVVSVLSQTEVKTLKLSSKHQGAPCKVTMDDTESFIIVGFTDGVLEVCLTASGESVIQLQYHTSIITSLMYRAGTLVSSSTDGECHVLQLLPLLEKQLAAVSDATFSTWDGWTQFEASDIIPNTPDKQVELDDSTVKDTDKSLSCMIMSPDGKSVIASSSISRIKFYSIETGAVEQEIMTSAVDKMYLAGRNTVLMAHAVNPQEKTNRLLQMWKLETGSMLRMGEEGSVPIYCSCSLPDDNLIFTVAPQLQHKTQQSGLVISLFDLFELQWSTRMVADIGGDMNSDNVSLLGSVRSVRAGAASIAGDSRTSSPELSSVISVVLQHFSQTKSHFYTFTLKGTDSLTIEMMRCEPMTFKCVSSRATVLLASGRAVTGCTDGSLQLWDVTMHSLEAELHDPALAAPSKQRGLKAGIARKAAHNASITTVATNKQGTNVASGDQLGTIKTWNISDLSLSSTLICHTKQIDLLRFTSDGHVVSAGADCLICVSRGTTCLATFNTHDEILDLHLTPDKVLAQLRTSSPSLIMLKFCNM